MKITVEATRSFVKQCKELDELFQFLNYTHGVAALLGGKSEELDRINSAIEHLVNDRSRLLENFRNQFTR